jgi:hypothetical protein
MRDTGIIISFAIMPIRFRGTYPVKERSTSNACPFCLRMRCHNTFQMICDVNFTLIEGNGIQSCFILEILQDKSASDTSM